MTTPLKPWVTKSSARFGAGEIAHREAGEVERLRGRAAQFVLVVDQKHEWRASFRGLADGCADGFELDGEERAALRIVRQLQDCRRNP